MKTHASRQILDSGRYNFLPVAPMVTILVFLKSQCKRYESAGSGTIAPNIANRINSQAKPKVVNF